MITIHCVDTSGSMSDNQIKTAQQEVLKRFKRGDIVVLFDIDYQIVMDLERPFNSYPYGHGFGGGTDATQVLEFVKELNAQSILYSDGYMLDGQLAAFNNFVEIK